MGAFSDFRRTDVFRHGALVFASALVVNGANYGFHFVVSRRVPTTSYGDVYALITLLALLGIATTAASTIVIRAAAEANVHGGPAEVAALHRVARRWSLRAALGCMGAAAAASPLIISFLHIQHPRQMVPWVLIVGASFLAPPMRAILQGAQDFRGFAISSVIEGGGKLMLGGGAAWFGFRGYGALYGIAAGMLLSLLYTELRLRRAAPREHTPLQTFERARFVAMARGIVVCTIGTTALLSTDALLAKHYLSPQDAGLYSAVSLAGKVLMFAVGFLPALILPKVADARARGQHANGLVFGAIGFTAVVSGVLLGIYGFAPGLVLRVMVGPAYGAAAGYLLDYGVAMTVLAFTSILVAYHVASHSFRFVGPLIAVAAAEVVGISFYHNGPQQIIDAMLFAQVAAFIVCAIPGGRTEGHAAVAEPLSA